MTSSTQRWQSTITIFYRRYIIKWLFFHWGCSQIGSSSPPLGKKTCEATTQIHRNLRGFPPECHPSQEIAGPSKAKTQGQWWLIIVPYFSGRLFLRGRPPLDSHVVFRFLHCKKRRKLRGQNSSSTSIQTPGKGPWREGTY